MTRKLMMAVLVLAVAGSFARADEKKGLFIGAGVGYANQELSISTGNFQDNSTAWKGFVGYRAMKFFGVEAAYVDFGKASDTIDSGSGSQNFDLKTTGETLELVGTIPLGSYLEIYGKGGYLWWSAKLSDSDNSGSTTGSDWVYGAGAKVIIAKKFGIRLEYEKYDIQDTKSVYLVTAGVEWRF
jgi:OOP family OmpA-OmpF porin